MVDNNANIIDCNGLVFINCWNQGCFVFTKDGLVRLEDGSLLRSKVSDSIVVSRQDNAVRIYCKAGSAVFSSDLETELFGCTGFVYDKRNSILINPCHSVEYRLPNASQASLSCTSRYVPVEHGEIGDRIVACNGLDVRLNHKIQDLICLSESGKCGLFMQNGKINYAETADEGSDTAFADKVVDILQNFDQDHCSNAILSVDSRHMLLNKNGKQILMDLIEGVETEFSSERFTNYLSTGYRPMLDFDSARKPVLIDPITLQPCQGANLSRYRFSSPDGNIYAETTQGDIEYFDPLNNRILTSEDYKLAIKEYRLSPEASDNVCSYFRAHEAAIRALAHREYGESDIDEDRLRYESHFVDKYVVGRREYVTVFRYGQPIHILIGRPLWFLNYVSFSFDGRYVYLVGRYPDETYSFKTHKQIIGLAMIYDMDRLTEVFREENTYAVWLGLFNKYGDSAMYTSNPHVYFISHGSQNEVIIIPDKSFLTFSPSGRYFALSCQGYVRSKGFIEGGHVPSCDVYIHESANPVEEIAHFKDHGDQMEGVADRANSVASVSFSLNDDKLLSVSKDGVVVVRNLHLVRNAEKSAEVDSNYNISAD